ncbi:MAG: amphi-Trp domain-containing protein [Acidimicrobiia bacterium]|jgi:amphi-Trp domain-containing protein|nr:amphi-Trp domain-containing protein [Acidimicrobiia bacterium]
MDLIEFESEQSMTREEAAAELHKLADALARNNQVQFVKGNLKHTVRVPSPVTVEYEVEVGADGGKIEFEISW